MEFDFDAAHRDVLDYYQSRELEWGQDHYGEKPAVLIIDMAYGWTDPQYPAGSERMSRAVNWIAKLLKVARPLEVPIVYTTSPRPYCLWYDVGASEEEKAALAQDFARVALPALGQGVLKPVVDTTFPPEAAAEAHARMEANDTFGKLLLVW